MKPSLVDVGYHELLLASLVLRMGVGDQLEMCWQIKRVEIYFPHITRNLEVATAGIWFSGSRYQCQHLCSLGFCYTHLHVKCLVWVWQAVGWCLVVFPLWASTPPVRFLCCSYISESFKLELFAVRVSPFPLPCSWFSFIKKGGSELY